MHDGYKEAMIGAGILAGSIATGGIGPLVVGGIAGGYLLLNGADNFVAGAQQMHSGEYRDSLTNQTFQNLGFLVFGQTLQKQYFPSVLPELPLPLKLNKVLL